jgi:hypothetical protein
MWRGAARLRRPCGALGCRPEDCCSSGQACPGTIRRIPKRSHQIMGREVRWSGSDAAARSSDPRTTYIRLKNSPSPVVEFQRDARTSVGSSRNLPWRRSRLWRQWTVPTRRTPCGDRNGRGRPRRRRAEGRLAVQAKRFAGTKMVLANSLAREFACWLSPVARVESAASVVGPPAIGASPRNRVKRALETLCGY